MHLRGNQYLHRLFRLNPRAAALAPAGTVEESQLHTFLGSSLESRLHCLPPPVAHKLHIAQWVVVVPPRTWTDIAQESQVDSRLLHGTNILRRSFRGDIVAYPIPISAQGYRLGMVEDLGEGIGRILERALAQILGSGKGDATIAFLVHRTVIMIHYPIPFDDTRLMGILVVVWLGSLYDGFAGPVCPMHQVVGASKTVPGLALGSCRPVAAEIEHHPEIAHALKIGIPGNAPVAMVEHGVFAITLPMHHVVAHRHADTLGVALGIVVHHERMTSQLPGVAPNGVFIDFIVVPPAHILVLWREHRLRKTVPLMGNHRIARGIGDTDGEVALFVPRGITTEVAHPILSLVLLHPILASPCWVWQGDITALLVAIPICRIRERQQSSQCLPVQQVLARSHPGLVAPSVEHKVVHIPLASHTEDGRTVRHLRRVCTRHHQPIFIRSLHFLINTLHLRLAHLSLALCHRQGQEGEHHSQYCLS